MRCARIPHLFCAALILTAWPGAAAFAAAPHQAASDAAAPDLAIARAIADEAGGPLKHFYHDRGFRPLWTEGDHIGPQALTLIGYLQTAQRDGLKPSSYDPQKLADAVGKARDGDPKDIARAELKLSAAFAKYVADQRRPGDIDITYADPKLEPRKLKPDAILRAAAFPKSFQDYIDTMGWMSPHYVDLRALMGKAIAAQVSDEEIDRLRVNLDRARVLPGPWTRHIMVDASSGQLWYYEAGKQVGTMRVVVGAQATQTPMLVGSIDWAIVNPYWNVPTYLARGSIAQKVARGRTLAMMHMQALSGWSADAHVIPASSIDWGAVTSGAQDLRLRQLPGPFNSMGSVKFVFPNKDGIYLHDTPERELLTKDDRHFSNGCIRLADAKTLGHWLLERPVPKTKTPEQAVPLPVSVPVYLTYITATATKDGVGFRPDIYGRDPHAG